MASRVSVNEIEAPEQLSVALERYCDEAEAHMHHADTEIQRVQEMCVHKVEECRRVQEQAREVLYQARRALEACNSYVSYDDDDFHSCYAEEAAVAQARRAEVEAARKFQKARGISSRVEKQGSEYRRSQLRMSEYFSGWLPTVTSFLKGRSQALEDYATSGAQGEGGGAITAGAVALLGAVGNAYIGAMLEQGLLYDDKHGSKYDKARHEFMLRQRDDPKTPKDIRGWINQELTRRERLKRDPVDRSMVQGKSRNKTYPGGNPRRMYAVPTFDTGHSWRALNHPAFLRNELRSINRARPGIARGLGLKISNVKM